MPQRRRATVATPRAGFYPAQLGRATNPSHREPERVHASARRPTVEPTRAALPRVPTAHAASDSYQVRAARPYPLRSVPTLGPSSHRADLPSTEVAGDAE